MEHLLSVWPEVVERFRDAKRVLLLTDYDGTLTPIMSTPELANLSGDMRRLLRDLVRQPHFTLGVISGRALTDLKDKVGISGIIYVGNHGLEVKGPGISFVNPGAEEFRPVLQDMYRRLTRALGAVRGVLVENKRLTLSIHYRLAEECKAGEIERIVKQVVYDTGTAGQVKITSGKKVYEVRPPVDWDKGEVVKILMRQYGRGYRTNGFLPIYVGDDLTDEDGFKVIENYGNGISVFVGEGGLPTMVRYFLRSPVEVTTFLELLLGEARKGLK